MTIMTMVRPRGARRRSPFAPVGGGRTSATTLPKTIAAPTASTSHGSRSVPTGEKSPLPSASSDDANSDDNVGDGIADQASRDCSRDSRKHRSEQHVRDGA
jgi:hypothetical protein